MGSEFDIVVAGGGIAGLSAGLAAARLGRKTLVLTGDVLGGNLLSIERVEGYPGFPEGVPGYELCPMAQAQAAEAGAEFEATPLQRIERVSSGFRLNTAEGEIAARALIVATGASIRTLGVPGEERLKGKGVSHCASCDGPMLRDSTVAVVGGGDSALQESLTLAQYVGRVVVLQRGDSLSAQASFQERVRAEPKIEVLFGVAVEEIVGDGVVSGVRLRRNGQSETLEAAAVFAYPGLQPNTAFLEGFLSLDDSGRIPSDAGLATQQAGVFAAGSVRSGTPGRAVASAGEGTLAAIAAHRYLCRERNA